jgi:hypothetical protein
MLSMVMLMVGLVDCFFSILLLSESKLAIFVMILEECMDD